MSGWIKLHRSIMDNQLWNEGPFTRGQAWLDILLNTSYEPSSFWVRGVLVDVKVGQCAMSSVNMAKRWGWSRTKVNKFLEHLETRHQIRQQKNNVTTLITIVNWEKYQEKEQQNGQQKDSRKTAERHNKEVKEVKEVKERTIPPWLPEDLWSDFLAMRKKMKSEMTDEAIKRAISKLGRFRDEGHDVEEILEQSIINGWKGLFPPKEYGGERKNAFDGTRLEGCI